MAGLECGHMYCPLCWNEYLNTKILEENIGQHIYCPATSCGILVDEQFVRYLITTLYETLVLRPLTVRPNFDP